MTYQRMSIVWMYPGLRDKNKNWVIENFKLSISEKHISYMYTLYRYWNVKETSHGFAFTLGVIDSLWSLQHYCCIVVISHVQSILLY